MVEIHETMYFLSDKNMNGNLTCKKYIVQIICHTVILYKSKTINWTNIIQNPLTSGYE